ncbi:MAG TPA: murein L,D-transpeptidase catalytic domain family protein, partial [Chryseosolibacter sp.]
MQKILLFPILAFFSFSNLNQPYSFSNTRTFTEVPPSSVGKLTRHNFADSVKRLYDHIGLASYNLDYHVFEKGMIGYHTLRHEGKVGKRNLITIIDFTKPSTEKRFYTIDLDQKKIMFHSLVAHGRTTGENIAKTFSNKPHSNASSLGFYVTGETYVGSKGYSLRLDGQEKKYNGNLRSRAVVIHSAEYVSEDWIKKNGRIGRSQGCPALPVDLN